MWIERNYTRTIQSLLKQYPVVLITGARQIGKTSILKQNFSNYSYVSFDDPLLVEEARNSPESFFDNYKSPIIIDEVQYVPELFRFLKSKVDSKRKNGMYLLTGSQSFELMQGVSESLAGRIGIIKLSGISLDEMKKSRLKYTIEEYLLRGTFPELLVNKKLSAQIWFSNYLSTYIERDVRNILNISKLRDFSVFIKSVASRSAQTLSYSELSRDIGVAVNTIKEWISVLEASQLIYILKPYHRNFGKRLFKSPKIYLRDTGLMCYLNGIHSTEVMLQSPLIGAIWETHVLNQILSSYYEKGFDADNLYYFRNQSGQELDFIIEEGGVLTAIEAKFSERPDLDKIKKNYQALKNFYGDKAIKKLIIQSRSKQSYKIDKDIFVNQLIS
jgi:uncharacterized protein